MRNNGRCCKKIEIREVSQRKTAYLFIKRVFDIVLSLVLIVVLLPLLLLVMAAIAIDSPGPVIFKQKRIGYQGKEFLIFKFRTLSITAPDNVATRKLENIDGCSTKLGRLLRRLSIDELPQLFNILRGDMSFVGFRPVCTSEKSSTPCAERWACLKGVRASRAMPRCWAGTASALHARRGWMRSIRENAPCGWTCGA